MSINFVVMLLYGFFKLEPFEKSLMKNLFWSLINTEKIFQIQTYTYL